MSLIAVIRPTCAIEMAAPPMNPKNGAQINQQGGCEVLTKACVANGRQGSVMDDVRRELRGEGAFKPVPMQAVPKHLLKDALVVARQ